MSFLGALLLGGGISALGSMVAGSEQAGAAENNAQLQYQTAQNNLAYESQAYNNALGLEAPYAASGGNALATLDYLMGIGNGIPSYSITPGVLPAGGTTGGTRAADTTTSIPMAKLFLPS